MSDKDNRIYIAIDLKSFYASVECVERGLDPLTAKLVVADESRTEKTICLAVSPALKAYGIPGLSCQDRVPCNTGPVLYAAQYGTTWRLSDCPVETAYSHDLPAT